MGQEMKISQPRKGGITGHALSGLAHSYPGSQGVALGWLLFAPLVLPSLPRQSASQVLARHPTDRKRHPSGLKPLHALERLRRVTVIGASGAVSFS